MLAMIRRTMRRLRRNTSGNATLLVALGLPVLIGGSGLAVDTAQWYTWKRELQFAVDQAALAGAWAKTSDHTADHFIQRARQEYHANLAVTSDFAAEAQVSLADFAGGDDNSVIVTASASQALPFSSFLTGNAATVTAYAQATYEAGEATTSCIVAVDLTADDAITLGGSTILVAKCGLTALSNSPQAITVNGEPSIQAGTVQAAGQIDDWFNDKTGNRVLENRTNLKDPLAGVNPPDNPTARTYQCSKAGTATTADVSSYTETWTYSYSGSAKNAMMMVSQTKLSTSATTMSYAQTVANGTVAGDGTPVPSTATGSYTDNGKTGKNKIYYRSDTVTITYPSYSNVVVTVLTEPQASLSPGTYSDMQISCKTVFSSGIYVINGGELKITGNNVVTGSGVIIVLKGGASIDIEGNTTISLTAPTEAQLQSFGVSAAEAEKLAGVLVFEARDSEAGAMANKIVGTSDTTLNGTIYFPNSHLRFGGTTKVTSQCLMVAASTISILGNTDMSTFCPPGLTESHTSSTGENSVKLVA